MDACRYGAFMSENASIAILIPCYNEEMTIAAVISDFRNELPDALIYVYDNNSSDATARIARENGAIVRFEPRQGKGNVIRQMLRDIDADFYVLVDGDGQHPASAVHAMLSPLLEDRADIVIGDRLSNKSYHRENKRAFHLLGNQLVCFLISNLFSFRINDALTGYRAMNQLFAKTLPVLSKGFQIEAEMYIHAIDKNWRIVEVPVEIKDRPQGSVSKLSTFRDGFKVIRTVFMLLMEYRPQLLLTTISIILFIISMILVLTAVFARTPSAPGSASPIALVAGFFACASLLSLFGGLIMAVVSKGNRRQYEIEVNREKNAEKPRRY